MEKFKGVKVKHCNVEKFYKIVNNFFSMDALTLTEDQIDGKECIFAIGGVISIFGMENPIIFINDEEMDDLKDEWAEAILTHEVAHCNGIEDEESADRWALKNCGNAAQDVLVSLWKERHGHEFYEYHEM